MESSFCGQKEEIKYFLFLFESDARWQQALFTFFTSVVGKKEASLDGNVASD